MELISIECLGIPHRYQNKKINNTKIATTYFDTIRKMVHDNREVMIIYF